MKHFAKETKKMLAFLVAITLMFGCVQTNVLFANATGLVDNSFVSEMELGGATVSDNSISGNTISGNTVSDNVIYEETASGNTVSGNDVTDEFVSGNTVSGNDVLEENESDESVSGNEAIEDTSEETVSDNNPVEPIVSGNTVSCNEPDEKVVIDHDMEGSLSMKPSRPLINSIEKNNAKYAIENTSTSVTITAQSGCTIYYSLNGKNPTYKNGIASTNAIKYTEKFSIGDKSKVVVKAIAVNAAGLCSPVSTVTYTFKPTVSEIKISALGSTTNNGKTSVKLLQGKSLQLKADLSPAYAPDKKIVWSITSAQDNSSNLFKLSSKGKVTTKKKAPKGSYKITASLKNNPDVKETITVNVVEYPDNYDFKVSKKNIELTTKGTTAASDNLMQYIDPLDYTEGYFSAKSFVWTSSNEAIATVNAEGVVKSVPGAKGKAVISAIAKDGSLRTTKFNIKVYQQARSVEIIGNPTIVEGKRSMQLKAVVYPIESASQKVKWEIVEQGIDSNIKISSTGKVSIPKYEYRDFTVKATAQDGSNKSATFEVDITPKLEYFEIYGDHDIQLYRVAGNCSAQTTWKCSIYSRGTSLKNCDMRIKSSLPGIVNATYDSSKEEITVKTTGAGTGTATITFYANDGSGMKDTMKVKVINPPSSLSIEVPNGSKGSLATGGTYKLNAVLGTKYGDPGKREVYWGLKNAPRGVTINEKTGVLKINSNVAYNEKFQVVLSDSPCKDATMTFTTTEPLRQVGLGLKGLVSSMYCDRSYEYSIAADPVSWSKGDGPWFVIDIDNITKDYEITANKADVEIKYNAKTYTATITPHKKGTYKITVKALDGTGKKKTYTVKVK